MEQERPKAVVVGQLAMVPTNRIRASTLDAIRKCIAQDGTFEIAFSVTMDMLSDYEQGRTEVLSSSCVIAVEEGATTADVAAASATWFTTIAPERAAELVRQAAVEGEATGAT